MNLEILTAEQLRNIKGGDDGSDLSNTVQAPVDETSAFAAHSDLSNTVQ